MPVPITIPRLGWSMDEGTFVGWLKPDGAEIRAGEPLFELEGEKALQQVEALDSGTLRIAPECPAPGAIVSVGTLLGYLLAVGEVLPVADAEPAAGRRADRAAPAVETAGDARAAAAVDAQTPRGAGPTRVRATPRARRAAHQKGLDWTHLAGSGRGGRIRECDVLAAAPAVGLAAAAARATSGRLTPITPLRRTIATRMATACREAALVTLTTRVEADQLIELRQRMQAAGATAGQAIPTYTDILVKLAAAALQRHPLLNSRWTADGIWTPDGVHVGIAVDTPAGLMVPVVRDVPTLSLQQLATRSNQLVEAARARRLSLDDQAHGTFTITNLGMFGIDEFTPIVNLPEAAILGVGRIRPQPVVRGDQIVPGSILTLSLTFDHRVADGADAARFLQDLAGTIEAPPPGASD